MTRKYSLLNMNYLVALLERNTYVKINSHCSFYWDKLNRYVNKVRGLLFYRSESAFLQLRAF
ncbi:hypothetical protein O3G_MSEX000061 [Manduca sexta]|nr:hypothetical protein O3G_MSEX000061 [Manduca sexta]KAG6438556.1 hypothetical protein O3G_MSEX000061 [Manduca sexta]